MQSEMSISGFKVFLSAALIIVIECAGFPAYAATCSLCSQAHHMEAGVGIHPSQGAAKQLIGLIQEVGFSSFRMDFPWRLVEKEKGVYRIPGYWRNLMAAANDARVTPIIILDYGNPLYNDGKKPSTDASRHAFAAYAKFVVKKFTKYQKIRPIYEVWNEWGTHVGHTRPGRAAGYAALFNAACKAIKTDVPNAIVLAGAISSPGLKSGYLGSVLKRAAMGCADGLSIHPYVFLDSGTASDVQNLAKEVESQARARLSRTVPLYVTEVGWPTYYGRDGVSERAQKQLLANTLCDLHQLPYVAGVWIYDLRDDGGSTTDKNDHFGIFNHDFEPKPAVASIKRVLKTGCGR